MIDWTAPETWNVGDYINADNWQRRWYTPMSLMLRRPVTEVTRSTDYSCPNGGSNVFSFDTVVQDDDGMVLSGTPNIFYAKRTGVFTVYFAATFSGNGDTISSVGVRIRLNGSTLAFARQATVNNGSVGTDCFRSMAGDITMSEGDYVECLLSNYLSHSITVTAQFNAPRMVIFWKQPPV
jgi:hypothetical protein